MDALSVFTVRTCRAVFQTAAAGKRGAAGNAVQRRRLRRRVDLEHETIV